MQGKIWMKFITEYSLFDEWPTGNRLHGRKDQDCGSDRKSNSSKRYHFQAFTSLISSCAFLEDQGVRENIYTLFAGISIPASSLPSRLLITVSRVEIPIALYLWLN